MSRVDTQIHVYDARSGLYALELFVDSSRSQEVQDWLAAVNITFAQDWSADHIELFFTKLTAAQVALFKLRWAGT